jgi:hypothetical protein
MTMMPNDLDINGIPRARIPALITALAARLLAEPEESAAAPADRSSSTVIDDEWLTAPEAARFLRCSTKTLYRRAEQMPCCRRNGRTLLFSKAGLTKWLARQRG